MGELEEQLMRLSQTRTTAQGKGKEKAGTTEDEGEDQEQEAEEEEEEEDDDRDDDDDDGCEDADEDDEDDDGDDAENYEDDEDGEEDEEEQEQERRDLEWRLKRVQETMGRSNRQQPTPDVMVLARRHVAKMNELQRQRKRNQRSFDKQRRELDKHLNDRSCLLSEIDIRNCLLRHLDEEIAEMMAEQRSTEQEMAALVDRIRVEQQVATFLKTHGGGQHRWWVRWAMGRKTDPLVHPFDDDSYSLRPLVAPVLASVLSGLFELRSLVAPPIMARLLVVFSFLGLHRLLVWLLLPAHCLAILFLFVSQACTTSE